MKNTRTLVAGVLAGIAAGATVGMLFAPQKGRVTRKNIRRKGEDIVEKTGDAVHDLTENITDKIDTLKREVKKRF